MLIIICSLLLASIALLQAAPSATALKILPHDSLIHIDGRYKVTENGIIEFDAPGFRFNVVVSGANQLDILLISNGNDQPHRFWIYIDGVKSDLIIDTVGAPVGIAQTYPVVTDLGGSEHNINIVKATEADYNRADPVYNTLSFSGFVLDNVNAKLRQTDVRNSSESSRKIQFIGDSITAGYCNMCNEVSDEFGMYAQESFAASWPFLVADRFDAAYQAAAWSGFGMYRNCCGGDVEMPEIYTRTLASASAADWDYDSWVPDVVVINLGTNDRLNATFPGEAEVAYQQIYIDFVRNISTWYSNPEVFLACGPMSVEYCPYVFNVIEELQNEVKVHFLDQRNVLNATNQCCDHPDMDADVTLADITISAIAAVMAWD